ncbi:hypothetical protein OHC33_011171 [Knufia fluminis]|uniref:Uncharacterized protein n=1 Tax=Knufia fluminis TaxID=191047 RepID=A0AAN8EWU5_9EURO|nr:hypothetical protein OHC33_011171 [Knufia fluminis]
MAALFPSVSPASHYDKTDDYLTYRKFLKFVQKGEKSSAEGQPCKDDSHSFRIAPLFTSQVHAFAAKHIEEGGSEAEMVYPQYGLLGSVVDGDKDLPIEKKLVFGNTSEPWSVFICGSQGSGKSHTLSCLLENTLLERSSVSVVKSMATGIVFHYDKFSDVNSGQPCEAAYLCSSGVPVTVLVSPTSAGVMKRRYQNLLDLPGGSSKPKVVPLLLKDDQLSTEIMMTLMAVDDMGERTPLYIASIRQLLRQMILDKPNNPVFDYETFLDRLGQLPLTKDQLAPLSLRLDLLKSVLVDVKKNPHLQTVYDRVWQPQAGSLTIVDLSDSFITESDACALFSISLKLFMGGWQLAPRIIALDEAHKFLRSSVEAQKLTSDLVSVIRQQRHLGSRVLVATQEPTVSGELLDLCNASIVHRFTSPQWYNTLRQHLVAAYGDPNDQGLLREIVELETGEAIVFCPTAILAVNPENGKPNLLRNTYFKLAVRSRVSADGGKSILPPRTHDSNEYMDDDEVIGQGDDVLESIQRTERHRDVSLLAGSKGKDSASELLGDKSLTSARLKATSTKQSVHDETNSVYTTNSSDDGADVLPSGDQRYSAKLATNATGPIAMVYRKRRWTETELEDLIYGQIKLLLGPSPVKDPWPVVVGPAFKALEKKCAVPERFFADNDLGDECRDRRPVDMMKRLLKKYYDHLRVPRERRAAKSWLRD